jgi:hypothetical protein
VFKESDSLGDSRARKHVIDLGIVDIIQGIRKRETESEVKGLLDRLLKKVIE